MNVLSEGKELHECTLLLREATNAYLVERDLWCSQPPMREPRTACVDASAQVCPPDSTCTTCFTDGHGSTRRDNKVRAAREFANGVLEFQESLREKGCQESKCAASPRSRNAPLPPKMPMLCQRQPVAGQPVPALLSLDGLIVRRCIRRTRSLFTDSRERPCMTPPRRALASSEGFGSEPRRRQRGIDKKDDAEEDVFIRECSPRGRRPPPPLVELTRTIGDEFCSQRRRRRARSCFTALLCPPRDKYSQYVSRISFKVTLAGTEQIVAGPARKTPWYVACGGRDRPPMPCPGTRALLGLYAEDVPCVGSFLHVHGNVCASLRGRSSLPKLFKPCDFKKPGKKTSGAPWCRYDETGARSVPQSCNSMLLKPGVTVHFDPNTIALDGVTNICQWLKLSCKYCHACPVAKTNGISPAADLATSRPSSTGESFEPSDAEPPRTAPSPIELRMCSSIPPWYVQELLHLRWHQPLWLQRQFQQIQQAREF